MARLHNSNRAIFFVHFGAIFLPFAPFLGVIFLPFTPFLGVIFLPFKINSLILTS